MLDPSLNLQQLAEIATEECGGDNQAATEMLVEFGLANPEWQEANMPTLIRRRMTDAVTHLAKDKRKSLTGSAPDILDYPVWGGKAIGNVSLKELAESARKWGADGETRQRKGKFLYRIVEESMKLGCDGSTAGTARNIPPRQLEQIYAEIFGDGSFQDDLFWDAA